MSSRRKFPAEFQMKVMWNGIEWRNKGLAEMQDTVLIRVKNLRRIFMGGKD